MLTPDNDVDLEFERSVEKLWGSLPPVLCNRTYLHEGCEVTVSVDWSPVHAHFIEQLSPSEDENWWEAKVRVPAAVKISGRNKMSTQDWYMPFFVESYLYDLFIVLNLALPGAADFFNFTVEAARPIHATRLELSAYYYEAAFRKSDQWPPLFAIDPQTVSAWYSHVRSGFGQVPETPVERAMFAMLHVCRSSGRPEDIVWLFYAFESLFQTRVGENYSTLVERISLLLGPNSEQEKYLRKNLRAMYDFRSSFVHGGLQVIHPMHQESMDERVDNHYSTIVKHSEYGIKLLVACFHRYVHENWHRVRYKTTIEPENGGRGNGDILL